jgi:hypothetical protein
MARPLGDVSYKKFLAAVDSRLNAYPTNKRTPAVIAQVNEAVREAFASQNVKVRNAEIKRANDWIKAQDRKANPPGKAGRPVKPETMKAIRAHFPEEVVVAFEKGSLPVKQRQKVLAAARIHATFRKAS